MTEAGQAHVAEAREILSTVGMPRPQSNERSALVLLALVDLIPNRPWPEALSRLIGITPIMDWCAEHYGRRWKPNTRETVRRKTMHQFVSSGIAIYNPDDPDRSVNSPAAVYQISPEMLSLVQVHGTSAWPSKLEKFLSERETLASRYAAIRRMRLVPVQIPDDAPLALSAGKHSVLIKAIIEEFAARFVPGADLIYVGDTMTKWALFAERRLQELGVVVDSHGKMPDVVLQDSRRGWLVLVEAVTSHGPVDSKRHDELAALFRNSRMPLVYVTAFPSRMIMKRHLTEISWETEVWCADAPSHLIHFNGSRFLGPY